ncbi:MAG TPA: hypothetical protein VGF97_15515 [Rhizomicrobium sp.]|jgi:hypothetical protein
MTTYCDIKGISVAPISRQNGLPEFPLPGHVPHQKLMGGAYFLQTDTSFIGVR